MRFRQPVSLLVLLLLVSAPALAQVPQLLNYQGKLVSGGEPVNGDQTLTFRIYDVDTGGTELWSETQTVPVADGVFSVILGSITPLGDVFGGSGERYLGVQVQGESEMTPRLQFVSSSYAMRTLRADDVADGAITAAKIQDGAVAANKLEDAAVIKGKIAPNAVGATELEDGSVAATKLAQMGAAQGQVLKWEGGAWQPAADNVGTPGGGITEIVAGTGLTGGGTQSPVTLAIADGGVGGAQIATEAITRTKIGDQAVYNSKIRDGAVSAEKIATGAVLASKLDQMGAAAGQVLKWTGTMWAPAADSTGIGGGGISEIVAGTGLTGGGTQSPVTLAIADAGVGGAQIADGAVTPTKIADQAVRNTKIRDGAVSAGKIAAGAITVEKIADAAVTSAKIGANAVGSSQLEDAVTFGSSRNPGDVRVSAADEEAQVWAGTYTVGSRRGPLLYLLDWKGGARAGMSINVDNVGFIFADRVQGNGMRARGGPPGPFGENNVGYAFDSPGDNDSGMFSSSDGVVEFYTNNQERAVLSGEGLRVTGRVSSTGGIVFPDNTVQTTAATSGGGGLSPIAVANIDHIRGDPIVRASTGNVTVTWDGFNQRYLITIKGETYDGSSYVTVVTPVTANVVPRVDSVEGRLIVELQTASVRTSGSFQFVTYKP